MSNKRGRPAASKNREKQPAPSPPRALEVWGMRAQFGAPRLLAKHHNVRRVSDKELLKFFGIGAHLRAVLIEGADALNCEVRILQMGSP